LVENTPADPMNRATVVIALLSLARFKVHVYALYGAVAAACGGWLILAAHA
ncbi:chromate transporter, partial [Burkholderia pseudomallei]